jgi:hypothetical protein
MNFEAGQRLIAQTLQASQRQLSSVVDSDVGQTNVGRREEVLHEVVGQLTMLTERVQQSVGQRGRKTNLEHSTQQFVGDLQFEQFVQTNMTMAAVVRLVVTVVVLILVTLIVQYGTQARSNRVHAE